MTAGSNRALPARLLFRAELMAPSMRRGDIGYLDEEGFLYISDRCVAFEVRLRTVADPLTNRAKDIIIRGGENIASGQIENALYADSRVKDAAVVPVPDPKLSELVAYVLSLSPRPPTPADTPPPPSSAVVVLHPGQRATESNLQAVLSQSLPKHCVPVLIVFKEEMPRNATGKTMKAELKQELRGIWEERMSRGRSEIKAKL